MSYGGSLSLKLRIFWMEYGTRISFQRNEIRCVIETQICFCSKIIISSGSGEEMTTSLDSLTPRVRFCSSVGFNPTRRHAAYRHGWQVPLFPPCARRSQWIAVGNAGLDLANSKVVYTNCSLVHKKVKCRLKSSFRHFFSQSSARRIST